VVGDLPAQSHGREESESEGGRLTGAESGWVGGGGDLKVD
jgi:hypothetical protein